MTSPPKPKRSAWGIDGMGSHFTVVYDACVLYPAPLRDLLMHLALSDLYRARWSDLIHDEWTRNRLNPPWPPKPSPPPPIW